MTDHYKTLGVAKQASFSEIRKAYGRIAKATHPDINRDRPEVIETFRHATEAYHTLKDPERKAAYDRSLGGQTGPDMRTYRKEDLFDDEYDGPYANFTNKGPDDLEKYYQDYLHDYGYGWLDGPSDGFFGSWKWNIVIMPVLIVVFVVLLNVFGGVELKDAVNYHLDVKWHT